MSAGPSSQGGSLRTLWRAFGDRGRALRTAVGLRMLASVAMAVPVVAVAWTVDRIRTGELTADEAVAVAIVVVGSVLVQYGLWYASNYYAWVQTFHAVGEGRIAALRHVQALPIGTVTGRRTGEVGAVLGADHEQVAVFAHNGLMTLVGGAALPVVTVVGLAFVDLPLALVTAASIAAAVPVFRWVNRSFVRQALARADTLAEANGRIVEYVQGIATARSYNRVGVALDWYRDAVARMRRVNDDLAVRITPLAYAAIGMAFLGCPLVIAAVGYWLLGGRIDGFTAVVFLVLVLRVYAPLVSVAIEIEGLRLTDAALTRIQRLHALPRQPFPAEPVAKQAGHDVTFDRVTFGYDADRPVLHEVTFTAAEGGLTALVGPSGAGKSTMLALAARFYDPDGGAVCLGGVRLADLTAAQLAAAVSVVFQDVYLFSGTVHDNIAFGAADGAARARVEEAARTARCHDFVSRLPDGYDTVVGEGGLTLSGGERQRVSIARALLKDAPVVLLDEATAALDPLTERAVHEAMAELSRGRTTITVAHRLSTIRNADRIVVVDGGRVVQQGRHEELAGADGLYARLWAERERAARWRVDARG